MRPPSNKNFYDYLWDAWCIFSVVGLWPRFIEPNLLEVSHIELEIDRLPDDLHGLKIVQFSDLHLDNSVPQFFLRKIIRKINRLNPDLLFFTGDFICRSVLDDSKALQDFLNALKARYGSFAIFGNHDFEKCLSVNSQGDYDIIENEQSSLFRGFQRLFTEVKVTGILQENARKVNIHSELVDALKQTSFQILNNETVKIPIRESILNVCGLGEYMAGRCLPAMAFKEYDEKHPGIILTHNPDSLPLLQSYPGEIVLCGHTHGCQINLPWIRKKFAKMEDMTLKKGVKRLYDKWVYINRGLGGVLKFRWFSKPEILHLTLRKKP